MLHWIERLIGRDLLWRLSRRAYHHARREGSLDLELNGEAWLQDRFAARSASERHPLTIVDVGANHGQWSSSMLAALDRHGAPRAEMTLFEPVPQICASLTEAMAAQAGATLTIEPLALSDSPGTLPLVLHDLSAGTHHLGEVERTEQGETILVEVSTLDRYWSARGGGSIDLLKIDAEGYDGKVILGARTLIESGEIDVVQFEYGVTFMRARLYLRDLIEFAHAHGYRFGTLHRGGIELIDRWHPDLESHIAGNKVIVHPRALGWLGATEVSFSPSNTLRPR